MLIQHFAETAYGLHALYWTSILHCVVYIWQYSTARQAYIYIHLRLFWCDKLFDLVELGEGPRSPLNLGRGGGGVVDCVFVAKAICGFSAESAYCTMWCMWRYVTAGWHTSMYTWWHYHDDVIKRLTRGSTRRISEVLKSLEVVNYVLAAKRMACSSST